MAKLLLRNESAHRVFDCSSLPHWPPRECRPAWCHWHAFTASRYYLTRQIALRQHNTSFVFMRRYDARERAFRTPDEPPGPCERHHASRSRERAHSRRLLGYGRSCACPATRSICVGGVL